MGLGEAVVAGAAELTAAADAGTDAALAPPTLGTVTAVVSAAAVTVELTVTVAGPPDPELFAVHAAARTPTATSRAAISPGLIGVVRPSTCMSTIQCLFVHFAEPGSFAGSASVGRKLPLLGTYRMRGRLRPSVSMVPVAL
jgi:hypothetical protein